MERIFLQTHESREVVLAESLIQKHLGRDKLREGFVASDMDGTMFRNDLGILVFIESLCDPQYWDHRPDRLRDALIPQKYEEALRKGMTEHIPDLSASDCRRALQLRDDIIHLYELQRGLADKNPQLDVYHLVVNEFARKMLELDSHIMKLEKYLSVQFGGKLLMRARFLFGKSPEHLDELVRRAMQHSDLHARDRFLVLQAHPENKRNFDQQLGPRELPPVIVDRMVRVRRDIRKLLGAFRFDFDMDIAVITTNLQSLAAGAVHNSSYKFLCESANRPLLIRGSELSRPLHRRRIKGKRIRPFRPRLKGIPPMGEEKRRIAHEIAKTHGRVMMVACGDSYRGDGAMGLMALENGGVFVAAGDTYKETRKRFEPLLQDAIRLKIDGAQKRIWYAVTQKKH